MKNRTPAIAIRTVGITKTTESVANMDHDIAKCTLHVTNAHAVAMTSNSSSSRADPPPLLNKDTMMLKIQMLSGIETVVFLPKNSTVGHLRDLAKAWCICGEEKLLQLVIGETLVEQDNVLLASLGIPFEKSAVTVIARERIIPA